MKRMITSLACAAMAIGLCTFAAADELLSNFEVRVNPVTHERMMIPEHCGPDGCQPCEVCPGATQPEEVPAQTGPPTGPCEECCCCPRPCWYFQAEALWLRRNNPEHFPISFPGSNDPPILSTDDLRFGFEPGYRFTVGRAICDDSSIEATYFGLRSWNASGQVNDPAGGIDPFLRVGIQNIANFRNAFSQEINDGMELHNVEINLRHWLRGNGQWSGSWLAGFRYVHVGDQFNFISHDSDPALFPDDLGLYSVHTRNDLFGAQLGGTAVRQLTTRWSIGAKFKGGLYGNTISQHSELLNQQSPGSPTTDRQVSRHGNQLASLIETGLFASFQITPRAGLIAGYDVFNITGLALAPEQLDFTATSFDTGGLLIDNGNLVLHGPYVGGWVMW